MTKEDAIKFVEIKISQIVEDGSEDTAAWEYRADCLQVIEQLKKGADIEEALGNI